MSGTDLDRLVLREVCRAEESVRKAVLQVDLMLSRRGYGPLRVAFPERSKLAAYGVHSCYVAQRIENRSLAAVRKLISDPKIRRRVEIDLSACSRDSIKRQDVDGFENSDKQTPQTTLLPKEAAMDLEEPIVDFSDVASVIACNLDVKPGVVELKGFHEIMSELGARRSIVLVQEKMTTPAKKAQRATHADAPIEVFRYPELFYDRSESQLWPACVPLDGRAALLELYLHFERFHENDASPVVLEKALRQMNERLRTDPTLERKLLDRKCNELKRYFTTDQVSRYFGLEEEDLLLVRTCNYGEEPKLELRVVCKPVQTTVSKASAS